MTTESRSGLPGRVLTATLLAGVLALSGCGRKDAAPGAGGRPPVAVTAGMSETRNVPIDVRAVGSVEAWNTVEVRPQVGGTLAEVTFHEGQDVKEGEVLFVIDRRPFRIALDQAEANLARDAATAATAKANAERYAGLVKKDYVTQQQADDMASAAASALATLRADTAAVETARLNLDYCTLRAPLSGRTGSLLVHAGNLVTANGAQPLVVINQITPVRVSFSIPETDLPAVRRREAGNRLPVEVSIPGDSTRVTGGELTFVDNAVDPSTGTVLLKATFPNRDRVLWPGQFVNVILRLGSLDGATVVPSSAVEPGQQGDFVYVIQSDQTVKSVPVTSGAQVDGFTVVQGIEPGLQVVTDGQLRLVPGARVSIKGAATHPTGTDSTGAPGAGAPASSGSSSDTTGGRRP